MSALVQGQGPAEHGSSPVRFRLPVVAEVLVSFLRSVVAALFVITFVTQPFLIPSGSMERTLLTGDFLLFNKQAYAPSDRIGRWLMPYREVRRGAIIVFHHPRPSLLVKRVIGIPGDRLRIVNGQVIVNGTALRQPYAIFEPVPADPFHNNFPPPVYTDPQVDPAWWREMQSLTRHGELLVPKGEYFVLGDNRNHSDDSRFWGFVPRQAIVAKPLFIYFSLRRPSSDDLRRAADDRLGHGKGLSARLTGFARWSRIFHVVH